MGALDNGEAVGSTQGCLTPHFSDNTILSSSRSKHTGMTLEEVLSVVVALVIFVGIVGIVVVYGLCRKPETAMKKLDDTIVQGGATDLNQSGLPLTGDLDTSNVVIQAEPPPDVMPQVVEYQNPVYQPPPQEPSPQGPLVSQMPGGTVPTV
eukprot:NODE_1069_length_681_cov_597.550633_g835_i0.p1 GENE.NODE_1069_length_681_cov_597.550633_g835_i0~~NODE_1069_length_681_cov_597.550633_g835_i0.p1  ORF type:complete len:159 (+),score=24.87 NODE_1069_length_681_cov_597.550633_g835_i0:27-479(+)